MRTSLRLLSSFLFILAPAMGAANASAQFGSAGGSTGTAGGDVSEGSGYSSDSPNSSSVNNSAPQGVNGIGAGDSFTPSNQTTSHSPDKKSSIKTSVTNATDAGPTTRKTQSRDEDDQ